MDQMMIFIAQQGTIADCYLWPLVPAGISALVAFAVYYAGRRGAADQTAREVHRDVTSGPGGEARGLMSGEEYAWWHLRQPLSCQNEDKSGELNRAFYVVDASLSQLVLALQAYSKHTWTPRSKRFRSLLGWHAGMHIAWMVWYIGCASVSLTRSSGSCESGGDTTEGDNSGENPCKKVCIAPQLENAKERVKFAVGTIGKCGVASLGSNSTISKYAVKNLKKWIASIESVKTSENVAALQEEMENMRCLACEIFQNEFSDRSCKKDGGPK